MDLSARVLGTHIATQLQDRISAPILSIGSDRFTRGTLAAVSCFNFAAAVNIDRICRDLSVKNTRDLFTRIAPSVFAAPRIGVISMAVLGACFIAKGIGGDHPLETWIAKHSEHGLDDLRTFSTIKKQALHELNEEKKAKRKRTTQKARELKTQRFLDRAADNGLTNPEG